MTRNETPPSGVPLAIADQLHRDGDQDTRLREHSVQLAALRSDVAALVARGSQQVVTTTAPVVQWPRVATGVLTTIVAAALFAGAGMHDTVRDNTSRISALERGQQESALETRAESARRLADDRTSRDQLAAIQSDLRALRVQVDLVLSQRPTDDAPQTTHRHHR